MCLKIYETDPAKFLSAPELAWQVALTKTKVKLDLLTDFNKVEKSIRGGYVALFIDTQKLITNT